MAISREAPFYQATAAILLASIVLICSSEGAFGAVGEMLPQRFWLQIVVGLVAVGTLVVGEAAVLLVFANGESPFLRNVVCGTVSLGLALVVMEFLTRLLHKQRQHFRPDARRRQARFVWLVSLLFLLAICPVLIAGTS